MADEISTGPDPDQTWQDLLESAAVLQETQQVTTAGGKKLTLPTAHEATRIKIALLLQRKAVRDYLDVAALADHIGLEHAARAVLSMDDYYAPSDVKIPAEDRIATEAVRILAEPIAKELEPQEILDRLQLVATEYRDWAAIVQRCQAVAARALRLHAHDGDRGAT